MATDISIALEELLDKTGADVDFLREAVRALVQELMEIEVTRQIGAARHERTPERKTHRNGYRHRSWDTRVGTIDLHIPKLRRGSYFPSWLEPRRRAEKALLAVVQEAYKSELDPVWWTQETGIREMSIKEVQACRERIDHTHLSFVPRPFVSCVRAANP